MNFTSLPLKTHSKKYHKYITNIIIYHKNTTKWDIVPQNRVFTTKCKILPHNVIFFRNNPTTNCSIPLRNIVI